ncbi:MAG TPA: aminoglycoside phosphotransferase family protein [Actinomycetes bacterium]|nr:aminoglycoside phosphotransferase family protein [Actinomycetes bacterium]
MGAVEPDLTSEARALVRSRLPGYRIDTVVRLGAGLDNVAYDVNGDLIVRFSSAPDPAGRAAAVQREAGVLATVATVSPLAVPRPVFVAAERGCLVYHKVPGIPLLDLPRSDRSGLAASVGTELGGFLSVLNALPVDRMGDLVDLDDQPFEGWRTDAADLYHTVADAIPGTFHSAIAAFLRTPLPAEDHPLVFSHNDLGIEHVLVDPNTGAVSGIIDWSDVAMVDPAFDLGLVYRDLGPVALAAAVARYRASDDRQDPNLVERATFYARCSVFEDLSYGLRFGWPAYTDKALASLTWLFP